MQSHNASDETIYNPSRSECLINLFEAVFNDGKEPFLDFSWSQVLNISDIFSIFRNFRLSELFDCPSYSIVRII